MRLVWCVAWAAHHTNWFFDRGTQRVLFMDNYPHCHLGQVMYEFCLFRICLFHMIRYL